MLQKTSTQKPQLIAYQPLETPMGETAMYAIARLARCLAALLLVAGNNHAVSSRFARQCARCTLGGGNCGF